MNGHGPSTTGRRVATAVTALGVFLVAMNGGGFDVVARHVVGLVAWLFVLVSLPFAQRPSRAAFAIGCATAAFAAIAGLSAFWSESAEASYLECTRALTYLGVYTAAVLAAQRLGYRRAIVDGLTIGFAAVLVMAVGSRLEPGLFPAQEIGNLRPEIRPRLIYPINYWNGLAAFAAMAVPFFLHLATRVDVGPRRRALGAAALPVTGLVLYLTFSRGGVIAALIAAAILVLASPTRLAILRASVLGLAATVPLVLMVNAYRALNDGFLDQDAARAQGHRVLIALIVAVVVVWFAHQALERLPLPTLRVPQLSPRVTAVSAAAVGLSLILAVVAFGDVAGRWDSFSSSSASPEGGRDIEGRFASASGNGRYEYWSASVDAFKTRPIGGRGAGTWQFWWQRHATVDGFIRDSHSFVFDTIAELGLLGVLAMLAMFGTILWGAVARRRATDQAAFATVLLAASAAFVFSASIDWVWEIPAVAGVFFAVAGLAVADGSHAGRRGPAARRWTRGVGSGAAIAVLAWAAIFAHVLPLVSNWQIEVSQTKFRERDLEGARKAAERARSLQPWAASPKVQLAQVLREAGREQEALAPAQAAVRDEPTNWNRWLVLAYVEDTLGRRAQYERYLRIARDLNPRSQYWQSIGFTLPPDQLPR